MSKRVQLIHLNKVLDYVPEKGNAYVLQLAKASNEAVPEDETFYICGTEEDGILEEESLELFLERSEIEIIDYPSNPDRARLKQDGITYILDVAMNTAACDRSYGDQSHFDFNTLRICDNLEIL